MPQERRIGLFPWLYRLFFGERCESAYCHTMRDVHCTRFLCAVHCNLHCQGQCIPESALRAALLLIAPEERAAWLRKQAHEVLAEVSRIILAREGDDDG